MPKDIELKEIKDVEIFASGTWNGDTYTEDDLDQIVDTFNKTKDKLKPFLKIGHSEKQSLLAKDEMPKAGLISNVRRIGSKLLADFIDVPRKIYEVIKRRAFDKISSELFIDMPIDGVKHPFVLKAVALLGGETPAVHDLDSIIDLYGANAVPATYKNNITTKEYEFKNTSYSFKGDHIMSDELLKKIGQLEGKIKTYAEENAELQKETSKTEGESKEFKKENEEIKKLNETLKDEKKEADKKNREEKVALVIEKAITDGDIVPAQKDLLYSLITSIQPTKEMTFKVKDKEFNSIEELTFAFIKAGNGEKLNTGEGSERGDASGEESQDALIKKADTYAEKNKVDFKTALLEISKK